MSQTIRLRQVRHAIDSSYLKEKSQFRLKVTIFSPDNKELQSQRYTNYLLGNYNNKKIYFQNIDVSIPKDHKILVNVKHTDGNEHQRAIYFDEIKNNNGNIFL